MIGGPPIPVTVSQWYLNMELPFEAGVQTSASHCRSLRFLKSRDPMNPKSTRTFARLAILMAALSTLTSMTMAQTTQPAASDVPVKRVALFSSGVGYFEHAGSVAGDVETVLHFKTEQINDVLKSLVLQDMGGGQISSVSYPSQDPLGKLLKGFAVDLSGNPTVADLLGQLRGAEVKVIASGGNVLDGKILGVESRKTAVGEVVLEQAVLTIVTGRGIESVQLDFAQSIQLADAKLQDELTKALLAVAGARDSDKKNVTLHFKGNGNRQVKVGYVVETPVWKTSYRLVIDEKSSNLQGWAIVENQTDMDWKDIDLSLVSGRPLSFTMDLYEPMYLPRPEAHLELFEGLKPQTYGEAREEVEMAKSIAPAAAPMQEMARRRALSVQSAAGGRADGNDAYLIPDSDAVRSQATAGQIGELFEYSLSGITLERQSSAMVPIVTDPIEVNRVSIYNQAVLARHPLSGAKIKNTTGKHLLQGPITVFQGGGYAGDAQINNVPPGQERLISYGIDLQTLIDADKTEQRDEIQSIKLVKGVLEVTNKSVSTHTFQMQNKSDKAKTLIIEQPKMGGWDLVEDVKPSEKTDALYRFERKLEAGKSDELKVSQQRINLQRVGLVDSNVDQLLWYVKYGKTSDAVKAALQKAIDLRQQQVDLERQIADANAQMQAISQEQNRMRENMKTVDKNTPYYARLMKKLDEQETSIEGFQTKVSDLTAARDAKRGELEAYLKDLNVG